MKRLVGKTKSLTVSVKNTGFLLTELLNVCDMSNLFMAGINRPHSGNSQIIGITLSLAPSQWNSLASSLSQKGYTLRASSNKTYCEELFTLVKSR